MKSWMIVVGLCFVMCASAAYGQVVITHEGANDPIGEGWSLFHTADGGGFLTTVGPVAPDPDFPTVDAWQIDTIVSEAAYRYDLTPEEKAAAGAEGWTLTGTWRMVTGVDDGTFSQGICSIVGRTEELGFDVRAEMDLGAAAADRSLKNRIDNTIADLGPDAYYTAVFVYDPAGTVDYYIDGAFQSQADTAALTLTDVRFGSFNADPASTAVRNYSFVQLELGMHPPESGCGGPGDADHDGDVDDDDLSLLLANWGQDTDCDHGEFSGAAPVDDDDLSLLLANWTGPLAAAVPEPMTIGLIALGLPALLRRRK